MTARAQDEPPPGVKLYARQHAVPRPRTYAPTEGHRALVTSVKVYATCPVCQLRDVQDTIPSLVLF